jgi:hypothetical protein
VIKQATQALTRCAACRIAAAFLVLAAAPAWAVSQVRFSADEIGYQKYSAKNVSAQLYVAANGKLNLAIRELKSGDGITRDHELTCTNFKWTRRIVDCATGTLKIGADKYPLSFQIDNAPAITAALTPKANERWQLSAKNAQEIWRVSLAATNGEVARFAFLAPQGRPKPTAGMLNAKVDATFAADGGTSLSGDLSVSGASFADAEGLRAGEKIAATIRLDAKQQARVWQWKTNIDWREGEVFWQPLYFAKAGHKLTAAGTLDDKFIKVDSAHATFSEIGEATLAGRWNLDKNELEEADFRGTQLHLAQVYDVLLKPFLEKTSFNNLTAEGRANVEWRYANGDTTSFGVKLDQAGVADGSNRFKLKGINARVPWVNGQATEGVISLDGAELWHMPIGKLTVRPKMKGYDISVPEVSVPLLDGTVKLQDLRAKRGKSEWSWQFNGEMTPISMPGLTKALGWPQMSGTLAGFIPKVRYDNKVLSVDGALQFQVFDGYVVATNLAMLDPFEAVPRLNGNIVMSNLDLETLTRTFSFGKITGRIDAAVENMELVNWKAARFDARVASSPGDYPRKISQQAVQNISSLGGAGAVAAIQRSFLRIFEQFGYRRIGLSCQLRGNVCKMGGVSDTPQGYVIVQGGGIPAITVMGYNRAVGWEEFLSRVKAATQSNVKPVVK